MALIHETLYKTNEFEKLQYQDYLESLIDYIRESYESANVEFKLRAEENALPLEVGTSLGMIVMEIVSNSIKHAFPDQTRGGTVEVEFRKLENRKFQLSITDDGIGLPSEMDFRNVNTLGLQLVLSLVDQIDGKITTDRKSGVGCSYTIDFKLQ